MLPFFQYLIGACAFWIPIGCAMSNTAVPPGFLEGHLKIVFLWAVEPSDNMPRPAVAPETYAEYPLIILSQDGKKKSRELLRTGTETIALRCRRAIMFWMYKTA
jgi:hypothetical protein